MSLQIRSGTSADLEIEVVYPLLAQRDPHAIEAAYLANGLDISPIAGSEVAKSVHRSDGSSLIISRDGEPVGGLSIVPDEILSDHFGIRCAALSWYCADTSDRARVVDVLVSEAMAQLKARSFQHASIRVAVDDFDAMSAFHADGFYIADTMITYLVKTVSEDRELIYEDQFGDLRLYALFGDDLQALEPSVSELFSSLISQHYGLSRFHADPHFDNALAGAWYGEWCRRAFAGEWADGAILARYEGDPMGFICWKRDDAKSKLLGCEFFGSGLGASGGHSAYSVMLGAAVETSFFRWAVFDLHIANSPVVRAVGRHPQSRHLRVSHTFHLWLGDQ